MNRNECNNYIIFILNEFNIKHTIIPLLDYFVPDYYDVCAHTQYGKIIFHAFTSQEDDNVIGLCGYVEKNSNNENLFVLNLCEFYDFVSPDKKSLGKVIMKSNINQEELINNIKLLIKENIILVLKEYNPDTFKKN